MPEKNDDWSAVESVANTAEASLIVGFLENHDIPARVVDKSFHQAPTTDEDLSPIEVAVPTTRLEEARKALAQREKAFAEKPGDADSLQTDEGPADIDPNPEPEERDR